MASWFKSKWFTIFLLTCSWNCMSQKVTISGIIKDAMSKQVLGSVSVSTKNGNGITSDSSGFFSIEVDRLPVQLLFTFIGYKAQTITVKQFRTDSVKKDTLVVMMQSTSSLLGEVVITSNKKAHYKNKGNPAVELIRKVIANKNKNRPEHYDYVEYEQYEKLHLALSKFPEKVANSLLLRKYHFLFENVDSTTIEGKALIPVYMEEKLSNIYYRKSPEKKKVMVLAQKQVSYGDFVDNGGLSAFLGRLYTDINIYEDNILLFTNEFLSPIADAAPSLYRFYLRDTIRDETGRKFVRMYFTPRNTNDFLFRGEMMITLDSDYAVQKVSMYISPRINLNFVRQMQIDQDFEKNEDGRYHEVKSTVMAEAAPSKDRGGGLFGERLISIKNYKTHLARGNDFYKGPSEVIMDGATERADSFWTSRRHDSLTTAEAKSYKNIDSLRNMPSFQRLMNWIVLLASGYIKVGKFEIGPVNSFYSFNPVEGNRVKFGGRTTPKLSTRIYFEGYGAYGFMDGLWKGYGAITYSLNNKSIYKFPNNYIRASAQRETSIPGQDLQFVQEDNFILSFKRGNNEKWLYNTNYRLDYVHEYESHFSYKFGFNNWRQEPAGQLVYNKEENGSLVNIPALTTTELSAELRWAPHEQFFQGKAYRVPIVNEYPIFTLRFTQGIKGLFGGEYNYSSIVLDVEKRFWISQLGYTDIVLEGGYVFNQLPYPLLYIHPANQTYSYQLYSYNLMNFLEFVSDHYVELNFDHHFNGFFFNRIPGIKKLKLREVLGVKFLYGGVRSENDPSQNQAVYKFPTDANGMPITFPLNSGPYIEGSFGITNIFKLFRIDLVKRFSYLSHSGIAEWGVRGGVKFDF
ncbi:MAG TPA: DUF5686 family protein [Puia sp.]|nr:DUF5686 family protein [Puia sp.]